MSLRSFLIVKSSDAQASILQERRRSPPIENTWASTFSHFCFACLNHFHFSTIFRQCYMSLPTEWHKPHVSRCFPHLIILWGATHQNVKSHSIIFSRCSLLQTIKDRKSTRLNSSHWLQSFPISGSFV